MNRENRSHKPAIQFSSEQLRLLEENFPNEPMHFDVSERQLRHVNGQQSIIDFIRKRTRGLGNGFANPGDDTPSR